MSQKRIIPTKEELKEWKENLREELEFVATERPDYAPSKNSSINELKEGYFNWVSYCNGKYLGIDSTDTDRYSLWLVQEYNKYEGISNDYDEDYDDEEYCYDDDEGEYFTK